MRKIDVRVIATNSALPATMIQRARDAIAAAAAERSTRSEASEARISSMRARIDASTPDPPVARTRSAPAAGPCSRLTVAVSGRATRRSARSGASRASRCCCAGLSAVRSRSAARSASARRAPVS